MPVRCAAVGAQYRKPWSQTACAGPQISIGSRNNSGRPSDGSPSHGGSARAMGAAQAARSYRVVCALIASTGTPPRRGSQDGKARQIINIGADPCH